MHANFSLLRHSGLQRRAKALALLCAGGLLLPLAAPFEASLPGAVAWGLDLAVHWRATGRSSITPSVRTSVRITCRFWPPFRHQGKMPG